MHARFLAGLALLALVPACGSDGSPEVADTTSAATTSPTTTAGPTSASVSTTLPPSSTNPSPTSPGSTAGGDCAPWVNGLAPLVLAANGTIRIVDGSGGDRSLPLADVELAYAVDDTRLVAQVADPAVPELRDLYLVDGSGAHNIVTGGQHGAVLYDVGSIAGQASVLAGTLPGTNSDDEPGQLLVVPLDGSATKRLDAAFAPEHAVERASAGGDLIAASIAADLTEVFAFYDHAGAPATVPGNPTDDLAYGQPPYLTQLVLSPEGDAYAYLAGPDTAPDEPDAAAVGDWEVRVRARGESVDSTTVAIGGNEDVLGWFDYDGRFAVASFVGPVAKVVVVDTLDEVPAPQTLCGLTGAATMKDA